MTRRKIKARTRCLFPVGQGEGRRGTAARSYTAFCRIGASGMQAHGQEVGQWMSRAVR